MTTPHNKEGWYHCRQGLKKNSKRSGKSTLITIPWSLLKKSPTEVRGLKKLASRERDLDLFFLSKVIDGRRVEGVFDTKKDALTYFDRALIQRGKQPKYIFKKK